MRVAALIPAYQAAPHLGEVLLRLAALEPAPDVLVVDDGSRDATAEVARQFGARVLSFAANRGKGHALLAGFAALGDYDAVVSLDADGQHAPERLPDFVRAAEAGADLVLGRRERSPDMPPARRFANGFSSGWTTWLAGQRVSDSQCGFRLAEVEIPTVYGEEKSQINTLRDVPRIVGTMCRLTVERVVPPGSMREAARRRAAEKRAA